ncbi:NADH-quinone oxidoreductase subunit N [Bacillus shivajii]|uniref:NADH-quinone oxidoreductase subunit N n=1 Tax=Bacillus shivajii TaxID=1983719 RepID=UPI001CFA43A5|nr:NADH-quinone oxidoreductase subunit N [Bacillus shivajii]UCZ53008.1 NADH-quinone oxidoreductase subunit N [Bacillus shivajii]
MSAFDANWSLMTPEIVFATLALIIFTIDFMTGIHGKKPFIGRLSIISLLITIVLVILTNNQTASIADMFYIDAFAMIFKVILLSGVALVIAISMYYLDRNEDVYQGEYYSLMLFAALGTMIMVSSADLITLFIGLEILSISSYCLAGFKKHTKKSTEAALKYVILGGAASAFILYGMSFLYGLTGTTSLVEIGQVMPTLFEEYTFMVTLSLLFMLAGFGFKIAIVPFHMWAPDVYEGSPTPVTAFLTVVSKLAAFGIILRVFFVGFGSVYTEWAFIFAILAALTMIVGNFIALTQTNVKRLMAYSGIAQAGYILVPIAAALTLNTTLSMVAFYAVAYVLMTLGAFAVITLVTEKAGSEDITSFSGLYRRSPYMAIAMTVFLVSLGGLPLTAGFFGKVYILYGAVTADMLWLAVIMIVTSIVSFYYYFGIIKQMFMREPKESDRELQVPTALSAVVTVSLVGTILLGILPNLLTNYFNNIGWMAMFM